MKHRYKSIDGAVRRVRELEKIVSRLEQIAASMQYERNRMAKLAADGPAFYSPFDAAIAKTRRNHILAEMGLAPDGNPLASANP